MDSDSQDPPSKFLTVQPLRDLESNWAVDLAKSLEDYLLKICSGEITGADDAHFSVNFAEAALLLQGSIQVYSRKVEYLYNLVLHALEFISQTRSQEHAESTSAQPEASSSRAVHDEDDQFWVSDEIPVDAKNCLENSTSKDTSLDHFIKPPANLVVLEGECLDSTADGKLESYLLATNNLYRDFILLDPCDAVAIDEFLKGGNSSEGQYGGYQGSSLISKAHKSFLSPSSRQSGGTARKSSVKKGQDVSQPSPVGGGFENPTDDTRAGFSNFDIPDHGNYGFGSDDHHSLNGDFDDSDDDGDDDPWKPLNPHEPGNLKVKPFRKVKFPRRFELKYNIPSQFPIAKLHGTINPELTGTWEMQCRARQSQQESKPPPLYEKLRKSLVDGGNASNVNVIPPEDGDADDMCHDEVNDFDQPDFDMPDVTYMDEGVSTQPDKHEDFADHCDLSNADVSKDLNSQASLEDLCRTHLDTLLASLAENEKQTELVARVSTWKQRIEQDLEEEDSRPPFDIHEYGDTILDKLSLDEGEAAMSFTDVVKGQEKRDVARTFSALLQLVNDRKVDLDRSTSAGDSFCYTAVNPFHVWLLSPEKGPKKMQIQPTKKRQKSPIKGGRDKGEMGLLSKQPSVTSSPSSRSKPKPILAQPNCNFSKKLGKNGELKCTPDGKRRRRSRLVQSVDLNSAR